MGCLTCLPTLFEESITFKLDISNTHHKYYFTWLIKHLGFEVYKTLRSLGSDRLMKETTEASFKENSDIKHV